jgi:hypothetical protein
MAKYPNYDSTAHYFGGTASNSLSKERIARWKPPEGGYVHALHPYEWDNIRFFD